MRPEEVEPVRKSVLSVLGRRARSRVHTKSRPSHHRDHICWVPIGETVSSRESADTIYGRRD